MADVLTSNLYPPIIDSFMPAFIIDENNTSCKIYFDFSDTNSRADINTELIQVTVKNQKTNLNSLSNTTGIKVYQLNPFENYIEIESTDLMDGFVIDQYYKVQIRFTSIQAPIPSSIEPPLSWYNTNINYFSEWSTVCLIKRISKPSISQNTLVIPTGDSRLQCFSPFLKFNGKLNFEYKSENEYLSQYQLQLYDSHNNLIEDSGILYTTKDNEVNKIKYNFKFCLATDINSDHDYILKIKIVTNNLYTNTFTYSFIGSSNMSIGFSSNTTIQAIPEPDQGRNKIICNINEDNYEMYEAYEYLLIMRTSNKNKFVIIDNVKQEEWDEIFIQRINLQDDLEITYYDMSIEAGVWYKYCFALAKHNYTELSQLIKSEYIICDFEDVFLNSNNKQLKMRYDTRITSYKRMVNEAKTETLGSPYPFIRRNSAVNYKQFSLNGLITFHTDDANIFIDEQDIYENDYSIVQLYHNYNIENRINDYIDYTKEREFREKVINYLTSAEVFLLRTMTEGNTMVKLMDINLTPNQSLNNYIYTFTATAIEIDKCSFENYYKYKIFTQPFNIEQLGG